MENNNNQPPSSPSPPPPPLHSSSAAASLTAQLSGHKDSQKSSSPIFASLFPPPSLFGENTTCIRCSQPIQYEAFNSQVWSASNVTSVAENVSKNAAVANSSVMNMGRRSIFQERIEPCPLSSSIYYGGQEDMYICSSSDVTSKTYTKYFMKKDAKDDPNYLQGATRGNWWQGSLYY